MSAPRHNERILRVRVEIVTQDVDTGAVRFSTPVDWAGSDAFPIEYVSGDHEIPHSPMFGLEGVRGFVADGIERFSLSAVRAIQRTVATSPAVATAERTAR